MDILHPCGQGLMKRSGRPATRKFSNDEGDDDACQRKHVWHGIRVRVHPETP